jgi:predicted alpha/beta-hydrolase family hydrolase
MTKFLADGSESTDATILLAHGAGASMDSPSMSAFAQAFAAEGLHVLRFEFGYMAARREGHTKPPPRAETLIPEYEAAVAAAAGPRPLIIGGKSMGGRVASMVADKLHARQAIGGLLCLGYPFHPPGKPAELRTRHLEALVTPTLICQGTRDPFGTQEEVETYRLSKAIEVLFLPDGDHDLRPRKKVSGFSASDHMKTVAKAVRDWVSKLGSGER